MASVSFLPITSIPFLAAGKVNPLAISSIVVLEPKPVPPNASMGRVAATVFIVLKLAPKIGGIIPVATPPSIPTFILFSILLKARSLPSNPTVSIVSVGPPSKKSPSVCVPSVDTIASAKPAAAISCATRPALWDLDNAEALPFTASPYFWPSCRASLKPTLFTPIFDLPEAILATRPTLLAADAAPIPGIPNCTRASVTVPAKPSGSIPKFFLVSSNHSSTASVEFVPAIRSTPSVGKVTRPSTIFEAPETAPSKDSVKKPS